MSSKARAAMWAAAAMGSLWSHSASASPAALGGAGKGRPTRAVTVYTAARYSVSSARDSSPLPASSERQRDRKGVQTKANK